MLIRTVIFFLIVKITLCIKSKFFGGFELNVKSDLWEVRVGRTVKSEKLINLEEERADSFKSLSC